MKARTLLIAALLTLGVAATAGARERRHDHDNDNDPPGRAGGHGTNWENPPGWRGGPGASPDFRNWRYKGQRHGFNRVAAGDYFSPSSGYRHPADGFWNEARHCWLDNDRNPPGRAGGRGTNWENPPGWRGGPGASPDRFGRCR